MAEDWTVDIPLRTPADRQASKDEVTTTGTVLGHPASLITKGSSIRLKVSGFSSQQAAEDACPRLCFALRYMSLHVPIAIRFDLTPQKVAFSTNPWDAAANVSKTFGGADFGAEVHGIMQDGAPAIYPTGHKILMLSGGDVSFVITGVGQPGQAIQWIAEGADLAESARNLPEEIEVAIELFNLSGFEPSPRAAFIVHCTAMEQLFPPERIDDATLDHITKIAKDLEQQAADAQTDDEREVLKRFRDRILFLQRDSSSRAVQAGVARTLASNDPPRADALIGDIRAIYKVRHKLAHEGRADLGDAPQRLKDVLRQVLLKKLSD